MRFGLIGCGAIGELRGRALAAIEDQRLVAVSDLDTTRAAAVASPHGALVETDWRRLVERDDVDAVVVSTPPSLHAEMTIHSLESGKHVLCEKPLARNPDECRRMIEAAERNGRVLATGFNYRFYPSVAKARELFDSGVIGDLDHIRAYTGYSASDHGDQVWLHDAKIMGGGTLRDNGIHLIDLTCYFLGEPQEVRGFGTNRVWGFDGCEDNGFALIRNDAGQVATLQASWTEWRGYSLRLEIYGTRGCIHVSCFPMITRLVAAEQTAGRARRRSFLFPWTHVMEKVRSYRWVVTRSFVPEFENFLLAVVGKPSAVATGHDGLRAVAIADAATSTPERS